MSDKTETIADIVREMRDGFNMSWHDVDREWAHDLADRIEAAARNATMLCHHACSCELLAKMETENASLRAIVDAVRNCAGVRRCVTNSCESCLFLDGGCNSKAVVDAVKRYEGRQNEGKD